MKDCPTLFNDFQKEFKLIEISNRGENTAQGRTPGEEQDEEDVRELSNHNQDNELRL